MLRIEILNENILRLVEKDFSELSRAMYSRGRMRPLFEEIRDKVVIPSIRENFDEGGRPEPWEPISINTAYNRKVRKLETRVIEAVGGRGGVGTIRVALVATPLIDTGKFRRAAVAKARFTIRSNTMNYGNFTSNMWWALPIHQMGLYDLVPARPFVTFFRIQKEVDYIVDLTWNWVFDLIEKHIRRRYV
jgi:hypothetical protein